MFHYPIEVSTVFISDPIGGIYYIAEKSQKGRAYLLWSTMPVAPTAGPSRIAAGQVPKWIRKQAYGKFHSQKDQERKQAQKAVKWTAEGWDKVA